MPYPPPPGTTAVIIIPVMILFWVLLVDTWIWGVKIDSTYGEQERKNWAGLKTTWKTLLMGKK